MASSIVIATRESRLALWQAEHVRDLLAQRFGPGRAAGHDHARRPDSRPHAVQGRRQGPVRQGTGDRGWRRAAPTWRCIAQRRAHGSAEGFALACVLEREDPRDAFVSPRYQRLADLPQGARVGTSSLRRQVQLLALRPTWWSSRCAATSTRGCASSTKASTTPSCSPPPASSAWACRAHPRPSSTRRDAALRRPGRPGHRGARQRPAAAAARSR